MRLEEEKLLESNIKSLELLKASIVKRRSGSDSLNLDMLIKATLEAMKIFDANNTCMNIEECASFLGVCRGTVSARLHTGEIKGNFYGRIWSIPKLQFVDKILEELNKAI